MSHNKNRYKGMNQLRVALLKAKVVVETTEPKSKVRKWIKCPVCGMDTLEGWKHCYVEKKVRRR